MAFVREVKGASFGGFFEAFGLEVDPFLGMVNYIGRRGSIFRGIRRTRYPLHMNLQRVQIDSTCLFL
jgi:hypothetical protein